MSGRVLFLNHGWITANAPNNNGLGRFIHPLQRLTVKFCKEDFRSQGVRDFIENDLVSFAKTHPYVAIYLKPRRHRLPCFVAEYVNGERHLQYLKKFDRQTVNAFLDLLQSSSGKETQTQRKNDTYTDVVSIQGMWTPFTNRDPKQATTSYPDSSSRSDSSRTPKFSERVQKLFDEQNKARQAHNT